MKGIVFTESLDMVSDEYSPDVAEEILEDSDLPSGGDYSAVGTYSHEEMRTLVEVLSRRVGVPETDLMRALGRHLFSQFTLKFPQFFAGHESALGFLPNVETYVHLEVRKLYPDAELPTFACDYPGPGTLRMVYRSSRGLEDLAEGLIEGCGSFFGEHLEVRRAPVPQEPGATAFLITRLPTPPG